METLNLTELELVAGGSFDLEMAPSGPAVDSDSNSSGKINTIGIRG